MNRRNDGPGQGLRIDFATHKDRDGEYMHVKYTVDVWNDPKNITLIGLMGKAMFDSMFSHICFDFSSLPLVHSMLLGECATFIKLAQDRNKTIKLRFNKESAELVRTTRLDKLVVVEEV